MIQISSREPEEAPGFWEGMKEKRAWYSEVLALEPLGKRGPHL